MVSATRTPILKRSYTGDSIIPLLTTTDEIDNPTTHTHAFANLTLYEKKAILIDEEIDRMGMGRYQWYLWGLCGFGYLVDLMWAQAFGLILQPVGQEFGFPAEQQGNISVAFSIGLTIGAAFWGVMVDIVGRKWAFNLTVLWSSVFGLALGASPNYSVFIFFTVLIGFGVGGNIPIDTTITMEFIPQANRRLLPFLSIFQPIGVVMTTILAYALIPRYGCKPDFTRPDSLPSCNLPNLAEGTQCCARSDNMGWRYLMFTLGGVTLSVFIARFVIFTFRESPKYLVHRGRDEEAIKVLHQVAKFNKTKCCLALKAFDEITEEHDTITGNEDIVLDEEGVELKATFREKIGHEMDRYKMLFSSLPVAWLTILVWLTYWCDYFGFTVAGTFLPSAIAAKNGALNKSLEYTYRSYIYIYIPGIFGILLGVRCYDIPGFGRKGIMAVSAALMSASLFTFAAVNNPTSNIVVNAIEYFFQSMFNAVLYGFTPEAFPAPVRGTACGLASFWGRLAGIISPLIAVMLLPRNDDGSTVHDPKAYDRILYMAGGVTLGCVLTTALFPNRKTNKESV